MNAMFSSLKRASKISKQTPAKWNRILCSNRNNSSNYSYRQTTTCLSHEIRNYLYSKNVKAMSGHTCFKCESIFPRAKSASKSKKNDSMNMFINKTTGDFLCVDTGRSGSWQDLRDFTESTSFKAVSEIPSKFTKVFGSEEQKIVDLWQNSTILNELSELVREEELSKFGLDIISTFDLEYYDLRIKKGESDTSLIIPWFNHTNIMGCGKRAIKGTPIGIKQITIHKDGSDINRWPVKNYYCMLGLSLVPAGTKKVVLTMNELDAIAVNSSGSKYKAVSLPCGITNLPIEVLPYLEPFSEIVLWFDDQQVSWEAARQFARKLDEKRCRLVRPQTNAPNALKAISQNLAIDDIISSSVSAEIKHIVSFNELKGFVKDELFNSESVSGVKWKRFPKLCAKLKGHRRGELTVLTGPTGTGKTTFMSEYSLDLAMQGVSTLWGSFEIKNVRLLKTMIKQFARTKFEDEFDKFEEAAEKFQAVPLHFMTYNGPQTIKDVIHTMRQAAYVHDIQHIIIDNLQFMMGAMSQSNDRFMAQDLLIGEFRRFATAEHIHVTIVIHPRKEDPGLPLQISSIFGTAKATQEADNVLILQQVSNVHDGVTRRNSYIEVVKNRYDGCLGKVPIRFDRNTLCMSLPPDVDPAVEELKQVLKVVENENVVKLNGGSDMVMESDVNYPTWVQSWSDEADD